MPNDSQIGYLGHEEDALKLRTHIVTNLRNAIQLRKVKDAALARACIHDNARISDELPRISSYCSKSFPSVVNYFQMTMKASLNPDWSTLTDQDVYSNRLKRIFHIGLPRAKWVENFIAEELRLVLYVSFLLDGHEAGGYW